jgi:hypothetical protein
VAGCARPIAPAPGVANRFAEAEPAPPPLALPHTTRLRAAYSSPLPSTLAVLRGKVRDAATGEALAGVTVVVSGGYRTRTTISADDGTFEVAHLADGTYLVTFFFGESTVEAPDQPVKAGTARVVELDLDLNAAIPETIEIQ